MSAFANAVCSAIEGGKVNYSGLTAEQSALLSDNISKKNFMPALRQVMSQAQEVPSTVMVRLNRAVSLTQVTQMAMPVTGSRW